MTLIFALVVILSITLQETVSTSIHKKNTHKNYDQRRVKAITMALTNMKTAQPDQNHSDISDYKKIKDLDYFKSSFKGYNEDADLNFTQLTTKYGYPTETHEVTTGDGYILTVFRVRSAKDAVKKKTPLVIMHGLLDTADSWIISGPKAGLAYLAADEGYDVWLPNHRGSRYSMKHVHYTSEPSSKRYWNYTFHEHGVQDLKSIVDYVLEVTGEKTLSYIGHSQGTTIFYVLASELPEYNSKISLSISLAPVAYAYKPNFLVHVLAFFSRDFKAFFDSIGVKALSGRKYFALFCERFPGKICGDFLSGGGGDMKQIGRGTMQAIVGHYPDATSTKNIVHFSQLVTHNKFSKYLPGDPRYDLEFYNNIPEYDLGKITCPVALITSQGDPECVIRNVATTRSKLPNVVHYSEMGQNWGHGHYVWSKSVPTEIAPRVFDLLEKYRQ